VICGAVFGCAKFPNDPYQLVAVAQRLSKTGLPMTEYPQTVPNLTETASNLYELIKGRNLIAYPDQAIRRSVLQTVAAESARGWRGWKEKQSHRIDVVVALAMSALEPSGSVEPLAPRRSMIWGRANAYARAFHRPADLRCRV
jgi:phage terminase large subunit-like protein